MNAKELNEFINAWDYEHNGIPAEESTLAARLEIMTYRALAEGQPVSAARLAKMVGVPIEITEALFEHGKSVSGEWDNEGRLVGNVLTLNPTPHHFRVNGNSLYTWCSMDAIHLPGLLDQKAEVESADPVTGQAIYLTIPPDGVPIYRPPETALSIVLSNGDRSGPQSILCQQMHFFASRASASIWVESHPGVAIMSVEEVYKLIHELVHDPLAEVLGELSEFDYA